MEQLFLPFKVIGPPKISDEENIVLRKILETPFKNGKNFLHYIFNDELRLLGSAVAKIHLFQLYKHLSGSTTKRFKVDFFCENLRLLDGETNEIVLILKNYFLGGLTMYKIGYGNVIDKYFNVSLIEKSTSPFSDKFLFEIMP